MSRLLQKVIFKPSYVEKTCAESGFFGSLFAFCFGVIAGIIFGFFSLQLLFILMWFIPSRLFAGAEWSGIFLIELICLVYLLICALCCGVGCLRRVQILRLQNSAPDI